jgi:tyrosine-protein phosphatase
MPPLRPINKHGFADVPIEQEEEDQEPNFDIPQSREEKPAAYPNGPICIYESGVYLYFEPTIEQANTFDVIVNVASEVKNPYTSPVSDSQKDLDARRIDGPPAENVDFATLPERRKTSSIDTLEASPTTPKATPVFETILPKEQMVNGSSQKTPEYIHMMWEHNTDIVPDLYNLVKIMDDRVKKGKRVLVHCQCGVSRSASLIVAYGLYKNPGISVQEAYDSVKKRSKWIGPNMNLIMQLQEFRNGLVRANENRSHNQGFGFPRRSAGLSTGVSTGNRQSPFDRDAPSGPRTPRTAPLPPNDTDMNMQRASTGNMMSVSPGPLSAPSGQFFSPDFRRSWTASSETRFDLSPKASPTAAPVVDPKGHVVPAFSITEESQYESQEHSSGDQDFGTMKPPPVPNFSRQLPFRTSTAFESSGDSSAPSKSSEVFLMAPSQPSGLGLGALRSPMAPSFNIPPLSPMEHNREADMAPPRSTFPPPRMEFNVSSWSRSDEPESDSSKFRNTERSYDPFSQRATTFDVSPGYGHPAEYDDSPAHDFEITSPIATEFPKDPFARAFPSDPFASANNGFDRELKSPRSTEFHMAALKPEVDVANEDPFGLTSPTRFEFAGNPLGLELAPPTNDDADRRPSFQAILPPSHEAFNGFASLNGTADATVPVPTADAHVNKDAYNGNPHIEDVRISEPQPRPALEPNGHPLASSEPTAINPPPIPDAFLSSPERPTGIRTRFSSPNMREQRKLHKLQTEMEALLPSRSPKIPQAQDDLDALLSPRAEEFTRNPFHFDLQSPTDETSPASSVETVRDNRSRTEWKESPIHLTPQKVEDPRSPVHAGSSPIVRNIWDVL